MKGRHILVFGMARSGIAAAAVLSELGAQVRVVDKKTKHELGDAIRELDSAVNIEWRLGEETIINQLGGIDMIVVSPGIPADLPGLVEARERGIEVIGEVELAYRLNSGKLIAITGTNGKTTTTALTGEIFKNAGKRTHVVGNIGDPFIRSAAVSKNEDVTVCEVSSFQLETVSKFWPDVSAILNITEDHLDRHGSMEAYAALKARVFARQGGEDTLVLNYDAPALRAMAGEAKCEVVWFSRTAVPPGRAAYVADGSIVFADGDGARAVCETAEIFIPGPPNLENALAASAIAMVMGVPAPVIRHTLRTFRGVEHRLELVREIDGVRFINDSKGTNSDSTIKAVESMEADTAIILGGYDKRVDFAGLTETIVSSGRIVHAVLIGATAPQLRRQLEQAGFAAIYDAGEDFEEAVRMAHRLIAPGGGNVLLSPACASFGMFRDFEHRGAEFKRIVHELTVEGT